MTYGYGHFITHTHTHARARTHARTHASKHTRTHARTHAYTHTHQIHKLLVMGWYNEEKKKTTDQYAEEKGWFSVLT